MVEEAYDASFRVDMPGDSIDSYYMCGFIVPWAVLSPVRCRYLLPRVVEGQDI